MHGYIHLADLGEDWTATHTEAIRRLRDEGGPDASFYAAGMDGAWWSVPDVPDPDTGIVPIGR